MTFAPLALGVALLAFPAASQLAAQDSLPPWAGGLTASLGQPSHYRVDAGVAFGLDRRKGFTTAPTEYGVLGLTHTLGPPDLGFLNISGEAYGGLRSNRFDGGVRVWLHTPILRLSLGGDYNLRDERLGFALGVTMPIRRGGILGRGSLLRLEWGAPPLSGLRATVQAPVAPTAGKTRPRKDRVDIGLRQAQPVSLPADGPGLEAALANVRTGARRVEHLIVPYLDRAGADPRAAVAPLIAELRSEAALSGPRGPGFAVDAVVQAYHKELTRAFSIAASGQAIPPGTGTREGELAAGLAREVLRDHVLYPYDRLLGQWKTKTTLAALALHARGNFIRQVVSVTALPPAREQALLYVFQRVLEVVQELEREAESRWGDNRIVWLPLQLGLLPQDHDTQAELDAIIEAVVGAHFSDGNRVWFVINDQFQAEVLRSIERAEVYHVLWVHDFRGRNDEGVPDGFSLRSVVAAYYRALTRRIREYDQQRRLPVFMVFLDQHYYEKTRGRLWLSLLEHPLGKIPRLPSGFADYAATIAALQQELRTAVSGSRLLQAEERQYGEGWLRNQVKVHVNITNPPDESFWSHQIAPLIGMPDNLMRDHRKIIFYDVSEEDPYRGLAMYTGMGIGEHYVGATWEDRAIMLQGPAVLSLKAQARALLESQGLTGDKVPYSLRARELGPGYRLAVQQEIARRRELGSRSQRAVELHNGTGFQDKEVSVVKAVLYSMMPAGSLLEAPDPLWGSALYASLLTGSALRGCRVLFIAPSLKAAPSSGWPSMGVVHDLYARLIVLQQEFGPELNAVDGMLKTGIYNPGIGVEEVTARFAVAYRNARRTPFLRHLFTTHPSIDSLLAHVGDRLSAPRDTAHAPLPGPVMPKLHLKAGFFATREGWDSLVARPELASLLEAYLEGMHRTGAGPFDVKVAAEALAGASDRLEASYRASLPVADQERVAYFLLMGSANQDYRSMLMDGEASVLLSGWSGVVGLIDFSLIAGLSVWIDDLEMLDVFLPPPSDLQRVIARGIRFAL